MPFKRVGAHVVVGRRAGYELARNAARVSLGDVGGSARSSLTSPVKQGIREMEFGAGDVDATHGASLAMPMPKRLKTHL